MPQGFNLLGASIAARHKRCIKNMEKKKNKQLIIMGAEGKSWAKIVLRDCFFL